MNTIVITGCSSGIGWETALYLKQRFVKVYPTARHETDIARLKLIGFENAMLLDVTKPDQIATVIKEVVRHEGKIDVWFNNAGFGQLGAIEDLPTEILKEQFETNVFGLHECTMQVLAVMRRQGYGKIIQHSSVLGLVSLEGRGAYNASKYAIEGLTDTLRLELAGSGVSVSLLNTGPIQSKFRENAIKKLQTNINIEHSQFSKKYNASIQGNAKRVPFVLDAQAVAVVVHRIILSDRPRARYYITTATYILGILKRILSSGGLDKILLRIG